MGRLVLACIASAALVACAEPPATEPVARGRQVFRALDCGRCHQVGNAGGRVGPDLTRVGTVAAGRIPGVAAEEYIRRSLVGPGEYVVPGYSDIMPRGLVRGLSQADLDALVRYLGSLE
ncbi:MAG TPA: c-type cytochrome [Candidatus Limnocylindria bacterium]|nr:c-type cytochrome [Candidatus Limnocylindria bacterium]